MSIRLKWIGDLAPKMPESNSEDFTRQYKNDKVLVGVMIYLFKLKELQLKKHIKLIGRRKRIQDLGAERIRHSLVIFLKVQ
jgi:23S rRNA U2552 (ribose-2'-O)-methylase RlmE/FtsJ